MATSRKSTPAKNPEARMNQLINLAVNCAEEKLTNGTASSQIITLLLNLATTKSQLELEKLRADVQVQNAKVKQYEDNKDIKEMYSKALVALKQYQGNDVEEDSDEEDYY